MIGQQSRGYLNKVPEKITHQLQQIAYNQTYTTDTYEIKVVIKNQQKIHSVMNCLPYSIEEMLKISSAIENGL